MVNELSNTIGNKFFSFINATYSPDVDVPEIENNWIRLWQIWNIYNGEWK
jgi:hypothetical protein